ncbi:MAG: GrdX family protein [Synergistaceae bacterium]
MISVKRHSKLIVTNNKNVSKKYENSRYIEGTPVDVMNVVCSLMSDGYRLSAAPLLGNLVMLRSPFRSVLLEKKSNCCGFERYNEIAADSYYRADSMQDREIPTHTVSDYAFMDEMFIDGAVSEAEK